MDIPRRASHFLEWRKRQAVSVDDYLRDETAQWGDVHDEEFHDVNMIEITEDWGYDERKRTRRGKNNGKG
jgi:hypothetical protein